MKRKLSFTFSILILIINSLFVFKSCRSSEETVSCFPYSTINVTLYLNYNTNYALNNVGGWIYVDQEGAGTRGLIVVRTSTGFKVYDRNAPHLCPDDDTTLSVKSGIKIVCPKDNAEWILLTGQPSSVASISPKTYSYIYDSANNILSIYN